MALEKDKHLTGFNILPESLHSCFFLFCEINLAISNLELIIFGLTTQVLTFSLIAPYREGTTEKVMFFLRTQNAHS